jgi:thiol:disulfide interchange protein DsbD
MPSCGKKSGMKKLLVMGFLFCLIVGCEGGGSRISDGIIWYHSYDEALMVAKEQEKILLVDFYADWCFWCRKLDRTTFQDPEVVELAREFIPLKVDCTKDKVTPKKYGIKGLPTILFITPEGNILKRLIGYQGPDEFLKEMKNVINISLEAAPR